MGLRVSRIEQFKTLTHEYPRVIPRMGVDDGINAARAILAHCEFDAAACSEGLKALRAYRKEWDEERGMARQAEARFGEPRGRRVSLSGRAIEKFLKPAAEG